MRKQKHIYIKVVTSLGLLSILTLQSIWLYNTYNLIKQEILDKCDVVFEKAIENEASFRFNQLPKGSYITGGPASEAKSILPENIYFQEGLYKLGYPISLHRVDSIFRILLKEKKLSNYNITINLISTKDNEIIETSGINNAKSGIIETKPYPIRTDNSQAVQAILLNPFWHIFQRMSLLMIATAIMVIMIASSIIYQIKIINRQNKIAKMREDFTYAMIHDMKTPLTSILMGARILHSRKIDHIPEKREEHFRIVEDESAHLLTLADKVLTISKMEQHTLVLNKEFVLLEPITADLIEKFTAKAEKEIYFSAQLLTDRVYAEPDYLKEAISNLIDNAIKYSKESIRVEISTEDTTDGYTLIRVKDYGIGIAPGDQKKVFDKFERAAAFGRSKRGGASGFGIGLSYVMSIIDAHGGRVLLESIEGEYTEFQLFIPQFKE